MNFYLESASETLKELGVNGTTGLNPEQVNENREKYGANTFTKAKGKSFLKRVLEALSEPMILMLLAAGLIAVGVNTVKVFYGEHFDFVECVGIFVAIILAVFITVMMESRSQKAFDELNKMKEDINVRVVRDNKFKIIPQNELVVGDIILIETGDKLPADGRLLESIVLNVDESSLTGESVPAKKDATAVFEDIKTPVAERVNMVFSGCFVTAGSGKMVVTEVGDYTQFGQIAKELTGEQAASTPLQEKLAKLGGVIAKFGVSMAALVFIVQLVEILASGHVTFSTISEAFITSIILIVAAVPEGLPTIVAVSLSINIIKMSKQNALVKKLIASETVGSINVICSDKTGTLTENRMTVMQVYTNNGVLEPKALEDENLINNFCINGTANIEIENGKPNFIGNPTECALLVASEKAGANYIDKRDAAQIIHLYPFSSDTKNMTTVVKLFGEKIVYTKGSPEKIIAMCNLSDEKKREFEQAIESYQKKACRVLGFAHKDLNGSLDFDADRKLVESDMIFDGFVAITDPLREDVYDAVAKCKSAGITIKMLTGDNIVTARAIASELGILTEGKMAVEAKEIEDITDAELSNIIDKIVVIARSTPTIKMRVVKLLKSRGNVVAVTGDGINDAPALKNADVGIAMGIAGTEVSKEASDIVLLDDSFSTIVKAIHWGRGIYENFQRFIQFQLTVNVSSVAVVLASVLLGFKPFTALQLLWVNIIMDGPPALTLGLEPISNDLLEREPTKRDASIITSKMWERIFVNGAVISLILILQGSFDFLKVGAEKNFTVVFTMFVIFQLFNAFNSRELTNRSIFGNLLKNKIMLLAIIATFGLQVIITQFGGSLFKTVPLDLITWVKVVGTSALIIVICEVYKLIKRLFERVFSK